MSRHPVAPSVAAVADAVDAAIARLDRVAVRTPLHHNERLSLARPAPTCG